MKRTKETVFVLDTCIYGNDPAALFNFDEHDIYVPIAVMRELDNHKTNIRKPELAKNARHTTKYFSELLRGASPDDLEKGLPISKAISYYGKKGPSSKTGRVFFESSHASLLLMPLNPDAPIINFASELQKKLGESVDVIFITQDSIARITALMCGVKVEEYARAKAIDDINFLYSGMADLPENFWKKTKKLSEKEENGLTYWDIKTTLSNAWFPNQFLTLITEEGIQEFMVRKLDYEGYATISTIYDYTKDKNVWGLHALNKEQNFFMNALMNPEIHFVSGAGKAGSGKTLLTLAAALEQVIDWRLYNEITITKEIMPIGIDPGTFPGNEEQKMAPWLMAFTDNLDFLTSGIDAAHKQTAQDLMKRYVKMRSIGPMQGRTFHRKFVVVDEAENLTPKQALDLGTRAGPGTKFVFLGNVRQIASQYLSAESCGLTHAVESSKIGQRCAHVTLVGCERSELAEFVANNW
ncbi:MAG: PhoH family protein [Candidatus Paceibacterota bacterium]|nr:PhoH family protein [Candidatus Paceibacterota bacterium]